VIAVNFAPVSLHLLGSWIYALYAVCAVAIVLIGPWTRPVTVERRIVTAGVVAVLLAGSIAVGVKHSAVITDSCQMWGDGWLYWLCLFA